MRLGFSHRTEKDHVTRSIVTRAALELNLCALSGIGTRDVGPALISAQNVAKIEVVNAA